VAPVGHDMSRTVQAMMAAPPSSRTEDLRLPVRVPLWMIPFGQTFDDQRREGSAALPLAVDGQCEDGMSIEKGKLFTPVPCMSELLKRARIARCKERFQVGPNLRT
jgi:hypothetical protein